MTTTTRDLGSGETYCTGISAHSGVFIALTGTRSKTFKTEAGAARWLAARGYNADGSKA